MVLNIHDSHGHLADHVWKEDTLNTVQPSARLNVTAAC